MVDSSENRTQAEARPASLHYSAFISYNIGDQRFARWLHGRLETYRFPRGLTHEIGSDIETPRRLKPVFRDRDELTAAPDLTNAVREALAQSENLIVICSPNAVRSPWIGREVELFRALHPGGNILTALISGTPQTAFHAALRRPVRDHPMEPLAADFRPKVGDGRLALLKLIAPLAGLHLDDLVHRDEQRALRNLTALGAGGLALVSTLAVAGFAALHERSIADHERTRGGALIESMLSVHQSLRMRGEPLSLQEDVTRRALAAYKAQDLAHLSDEALQQRSRLLQDQGEGLEKSGNLSLAKADFLESRRTTEALLAKAPNDPHRIFDQAQSEYWVGFINWRTGDGPAAEAGFKTYAALAAKLVRMDPTNDAWRKEQAFAANNLGMLALRQAGDAAAAEPQFEAALAAWKTVERHKPRDPETLSAIANKYAWIADCQRVEGNLTAARASREAQRNVIERLLADNPRNLDAQKDMLGYQLAVARIELAQGQSARALARLKAGRDAARTLQAADPDNKEFAKQARMFELFRVRAWLAMPARARLPRAEISRILGDCPSMGSGATNQEIADFCGVLLARNRAASGDTAGARVALADVNQHLATQHDRLSARWGLNFAEEVRLVDAP